MMVSFVIPTRNQAPFIRRCLDSCLAQRLEAREIIVRDGLSTDGTQDVLRSYGQAVRWVSQADRGQADAVNQAVAAATGDVIAWINSDDFYPGPDVLPRVLGEFRKEEAVDLVYGRGMMVRPDGTPFRRGRTVRVERVEDLLTGPGFVFQPAAFFRRGLFDRVGGLDEGLHFAMDLDLWLRMFPAARRWRYVDRVLAHATSHPAAKTRANHGPMIREVFQVKRRYARSLGLSWHGRVRLEATWLREQAYRAAVACGLRRMS